MSESAKRFTRGAGWIYAYRWLERLLELVSVIVLARILVPEDFGVVAIAASYVTIIEGLSEFDVRKALIRLRETSRELFDTAWTLSLLRGVLAAAVLWVLALFVGDERVATILRVLALAPLLDGLSNPRFVLFERELDYSKLALLTLTSKVLSVGVTIWIALATRSYWALVVGFLVGNFCRLALSYALRPYSPRPGMVRFSDIASFSGWMSLATMVTTLSMETDKIIVGRLLGVADAGRYFMTQRVGVLPTRELASPLQRILFPSFSAIAEDRPRLRRVVTESINVLAGMSLPAAAGFALVASDFVPLALGSTWTAIVPLLTVLVPYLGLRATLSMVLPCAMALGRTRLLFTVSAVYAPVHLTLFIAGTALYGLEGAIWSIVVAGVLYIGLNGWILWRTLGISASEILGQIGRPLAATAVMTVAILGADFALPLDLFPPGGSWLALGAKVILGAASYAISLWLLWARRGRPPGFERRLLQALSRSR